MNLSKLLVICCNVLLLILSHQAFAAECPAVFPDAISTHGKNKGKSKITFGKAAQVKNNPDTILTTRDIKLNNLAVLPTCVSAECTASNSSAATSSPEFDKNKSKQDIDIFDGGGLTFGLDETNEYREVNVNIIDPKADPKPTPTFATLNFSDNYDSYHFSSFNLGVNTTLNLTAGKSYFFEEMTIQEATTINVIGAGTAIVYIKDKITFPADTQINSPVKASGDVTKLVMHVDDDVIFKAGVTFSGALYADDLTFTSASFLYGVAAGEKVAIEEGSSITYDADVFKAEFGRVCSPEVSTTVPVANFQFDECSYSGEGNEVLDQLNQYSGTSHNGVNTFDNGQIEKSLNITDIQHHVQVNVPLTETYSVSTWFKKPTDTTKSRYFVLGAMASGGDLLYLDRNNDWRWGVYDGSSVNSVDGDYSFNNLNDGWHHMALIYSDDQTSLYLDGNFIETINLVPSGTLKYIGTSFDGVDTSEPQGFRAPLDEFIIYDGALSATEVTTIYTNQSAGKNYDDSTRASTQCAQLIAQFSMEALSWRDSPSEVIDETGNFNAQGVDGATTDNIVPALAGNPGTCSYGTFDGIDDYIELPNSFENLQGSFTITAWIKPSNLNSGSRIFIDDQNNQQGFGFSLGDPGNGQLRFFSRGVNPVSVDTSSTITPNTWSFVTAVHDSETKTRQIYINGVAQAINGTSTSSTYTGVWGIDTGPASIGGETAASRESGSNFHFTGAIDEVHVFKGALTAAEINKVYGKRHACAEPVIHHYEIVHDGNGLTCAAEQITIKACTNNECASNSDLSTESVSLDFTVTSPTDGNIIKASPTFTGSTSFTFNHTTAETLILSINGASVDASHAFECASADDNCAMTFTDAGFRFLSGDDENETIAHQTSGKEFADTLKLQAVKSNNGVCEGLFSGDVTISLSQENIAPDLDFNLGLAFQTDDNDIAKYPQFSDDVTLAFDADSTAIITKPKYLDAGKIRLHAKYANADIALVGSSNEFWVKPSKFVIDSTASYNATADSTFVAGKDFTFYVSALNENGDITQNYRQSDGALKLNVTRVASTDTSTVNGKFTYADSLYFYTNTGFQPVVLTNFSDGNKGQSVFNGGQYNEVGIINVDIQDSKYGGLVGTEGVVSADDLTLGRFIPAYFKQTVDTVGKLDAYHSDADLGRCEIAGWAYTGQRTSDNKGTIGYSLTPKIAITAFNAQDEITKNYTLGAAEGYMKLLAADVKVTSPDHDDEQLRVNNEELSVDENANNFVKITAFMDTGKLDFSVDKGTLIPGQMLYTFSDNDHFSYDRDETSFLKPFSAKIPFVTEQVTDQDGVTLQTEPTSNVIAASAIETLISTGVDIRFARMVLANAYGSENARLRVPLSIEVYSGSNGAYDSENFAINSNESCLTASIEDKKPGAKYSGNMNTWDYRLIDIDSDYIKIADTEASVSEIFDQGIQKQLFFSPPSQQGTLEWEYEVPDWFKFNWDGLDGSAGENLYDDNPSATLSFGLYRSNDRIISWREVNN